VFSRFRLQVEKTTVLHPTGFDAIYKNGWFPRRTTKVPLAVENQCGGLHFLLLREGASREQDKYR
jgi:hypothetical protein